MQHYSLTSLAALASIAVAATNHQVIVGDQGLKFGPAQVTASVGDTVEFMWQGEFHSVTEGSKTDACNPSGAFAFNSGGKSSGTWTITINSTDPIYYYCGVGHHCQAGMVGGINVAQSDFAAYETAAKSAPTNVLPSAVQGGSTSAPSSSAASSASGSASSASSSASSASAAASSSSSAMASGASSSAASSASGSASSSAAAGSSSASASASSSASGNGAMATRVAGLVAGVPLALAALL